MLEPELQETYNTWKSDWNAPANNQMMLAQIQPWVDQALIASGGNPSNRAQRAKANMLAIAYLRQYNPEKSTMKNYLYGQLRGLHRVIGNDQNIIQIPERVVLGRKAIAEAERELTDELGRAPSMAEVADRTGIPIRSIEKWTYTNLPVSEGAAEALVEGQNYTHGKSLGYDRAEDAWQEYVYDTLPDRQKAVMERLYGMHGKKPMTPAETAKSLNISRAAVSQHKKKIDTLLGDDARYAFFGD